MAAQQATIASQQATIDELRARHVPTTPGPAMDRTFMEFMALHNQQHLQALSQIADSLSQVGGQTQGTVDLKNVGKPFTFKGDEAQFSTWVKKLKNYFAAGHGRDARLMMDWAEERSSAPITDHDAQSKFADKLALLSRVEESLYSNLNSFTEGEAFNLASNTTAGKGLEAFRKLCHRFNPKTAGRRTNIIASLTNPPQVKLDDLGSALEIWEEQVRQYDSR